MGSTTLDVLGELGWSDRRAADFELLAAAGLSPGRVVSTGGAIRAMTLDGPVDVIVQRRFRQLDSAQTAWPAIGDWIALARESTHHRPTILRTVLERAGTFVRQRSSDGSPQVIAANVDLAFLVSGLDHDLNLRRIERYLVLAVAGGVTPIIVLNKVDLAPDPEVVRAAVEKVAPGVKVLVISARTGHGLAPLRDLIEPGMTACLLGSSGAGKSTLTNALLGEERQQVKVLREDDSKGRHTTSRGELFVLPGGGMLIDTPGLRSVGVLGSRGALDASFSDIDRLAQRCRFTDCTHHAEPGCAVRTAVESGFLPASRLHSRQRLEVEQAAAELRADIRARREAERRQTRLYRKLGRDAVRFKRGR